MKFLYQLTVHDEATRLRAAHWKEHVDASGLRAEVDSNSLRAQMAKQAWDVANPLPNYFHTAEVKLQEKEQSK